MSKTPVAAKGGAIATVQDGLTAFLKPEDITQDFGRGLEGADSQSFAVPFLRVLQKSTPVCDPDNPEYRPEAKPGHFINSVTGEVIDGKTGCYFVHCAFQRRFIAWAPRSSSESYLGDYSPSEVEAMRADGRAVEVDRRLYLRNPGDTAMPTPKTGTLLSDTRTHFGLVIDPEREKMSRVVLSLSSTQIRKSRQLMAALGEAMTVVNGQPVKPPTWASLFKLTTVFEQNDEGSWYGLRVEPQGWLRDFGKLKAASIYSAGRDFWESVTRGHAQANLSDSESKVEIADGAF
jgi:hypothetical protein